MTNIDNVLFDLLVHHNCVIIPEFGGFISKRVSSTIDYDRGVVIPPSKHVLFNKFLVANDGLLISSFVKLNKGSYEDVKSELARSVSEMDIKLSKGEEIVFKNIGTLTRSDSGIYSFIQDKSYNLLADAYGLKELEFVSSSDVEEKAPVILEKEEAPIILEKEEKPIIQKKEEAPVIIEKEKAVPKHRISRRKTIIRYAAAACLLPFAFYTLWIPFKSDFFSSGLISMNDFNPFYKKEVGTYHPIQQGPAESSEDYTVNRTESKSVEEIKPVEKVESDIKEIEIKENPKSVYNRYFIVGCFSVKQNADNYLSKLAADGFVPLLVDGGKLYRVSVGQVANKEEFNSLMASAKEKGYKGWTLKK